MGDKTVATAYDDPIRSNKTGNLNMSTLVVSNVQTFFISTPIPWEMIQFDLTNIFQMGWNQQLEKDAVFQFCVHEQWKANRAFVVV